MFDVLRALGLTDLRNLSLLDAGCGNGVVSELFWAMGADVSGVDVSDDALRQAALRVPLGTFHRSPLMSFDLQREYDIVFCPDVLYNLVDDADWNQALERLVRHTSPGGYLFVLEHLREREDWPARHVHHRTLPVYQQALGAMGLIEQPMEKPQMNLVWRRLMLAITASGLAERVDELSESTPRSSKAPDATSGCILRGRVRAGCGAVTR